MKITKDYTILAIDTSCDETSVAITQDDRVLSNVIASQAKFHADYGGVVPHIAKRMHQELIEPTVKEALRHAHLKLTNIDAVAVTIGPGLAPALEVGLNYTKNLALHENKPFLSVNHMEAHLLSSFAKNSQGQGPFTSTQPIFPILGLLVSGGHTQLILMNDFGHYQLLGETVDDAAGEAFDKVAKMLELGYPGGPIVSELAKQGSPTIKLPIPMRDRDDLMFSFSGLKTACMNKLKDLGGNLDRQATADFAASFVETVSRALTMKLEKAIKDYRPRQIVLGGGVISNLKIRTEVRKLARRYDIPVFIPYSRLLFTDNAAMVGVAAYYQAMRNGFEKDPSNLDRQPNLNF